MLYRMFLFNSQMRFDRVEVMECGSDEGAIERARTLVSDQRGVEVWSGIRVVATLLPGAEAASVSKE